MARGRWLTAAVLVLALAIGGAAAAYVFVKPSDKSSVGDRQPNERVKTGTDSQRSAGVLPDTSAAQMKRDIESLLYTWHRAIADGEYRKAWNLMTPRRRKQKLVEDGYSKWRAAQASLTPYLHPEGLTVSLLHVDRGSGVVTVDVRGMTWEQPGSSCSEWSGVTWVKYEGGKWLYEPGYSTTPARRRKWEPRASETLGWGCN